MAVPVYFRRRGCPPTPNMILGYTILCNRIIYKEMGAKLQIISF
jgi:hypothetical protein